VIKAKKSRIQIKNLKVEQTVDEDASEHSNTDPVTAEEEYNRLWLEESRWIFERQWKMKVHYDRIAIILLGVQSAIAGIFLNKIEHVNASSNQFAFVFFIVAILSTIVTVVCCVTVIAANNGPFFDIDSYSTQFKEHDNQSSKNSSAIDLWFTEMLLKNDDLKAESIFKSKNGASSKLFIALRNSYKAYQIAGVATAAATCFYILVILADLISF
jgi:hypothetical protein